MWAGLPQLAIMPLVPKLMQRFDARLLIAVGLTVFGASCFLNYFLDADVAYDQLRISQMVRACGQPLIMVPLSSVTTGGIEPANAGSASGLFNMMRNLGGSMGIALTSALLTQREHLHSNRIGEHITTIDPHVQERLAAYTHGFMAHGIDQLTASRMALGALDFAVRKQAFLQAYGDCFFIIGATLVLAVPAVLGCKKLQSAGGAAGAH